MIAAWPRVAAALEGLDCALMGGTAVAMVLRHRHSHDLDFMTLQPFDSQAVAAKLSAAARAAYKDDDLPHIARSRLRQRIGHRHERSPRIRRQPRHPTRRPQYRRRHRRRVGPGSHGHQTRSDPTLPQGCDYIDIAALDRAGVCTIEDGLRYHKQRYAPTVTYEETLRIAQLATNPPPTDPDPAFNDHLADAANHLAARRRAILDWALQSGQRPRPPQPDPRTRTLTRHHGTSQAGSLGSAPALGGLPGAQSLQKPGACPIWYRTRRTTSISDRTPAGPGTSLSIASMKPLTRSPRPRGAGLGIAQSMDLQHSRRDRRPVTDRDIPRDETCRALAGTSAAQSSGSLR